MIEFNLKMYLFGKWYSMDVFLGESVSFLYIIKWKYLVMILLPLLKKHIFSVHLINIFRLVKLLSVINIIFINWNYGNVHAYCHCNKLPR